MKVLRAQLLVSATAALALAGCGGGQAPLSPSSSTGTNLSHHAGPLSDPSTVVEIQNGWTGTISGSGSADCWTIAPPLPILGAGDSSSPITLSFHVSTTCGVPSSLGITYGPFAVTGNRCTFYTVFNAGGFSYAVTQTDNTACKIVYPPNGINAIFVYAQKSSASRRTGSPQLHFNGRV